MIIMTFPIFGILICLSFAATHGYNKFCPMELITEEQKSSDSIYSDPPKLTNIGYVGASYDIFKGNPEAIGQLDPGFVSGQNIFTFTYNGKKTTTDGAYLIPDGTTVNSVESCSFSFSSTITKNTQSYSDSLKVHVDASFKYMAASFSASSDYQEVHKTTSSSESVYVSSQAECETYGASIDDASLSSFFVDDIKALPTTGNYSLDPYINLIRTWGTHIASSIMMGGRYGLRSEFTSSSYNSMSSTKLNVKASAGYSGAVSVSASLATDQEKEDAKTFENNRKDVHLFQLGGKPPVDENGTTFQWAQTVKATPMPLSYRLTELYKYLTLYYIPDDKNLVDKQKNLKLALTAYCKEIVPDPQLCDEKYGPKQGNKVRVSLINSIFTACGFEINSSTYYQGSENPNMRVFGAVKGPFNDSDPSPFVMADARSASPDIIMPPIGIVGTSKNRMFTRYKCPEGFSTVGDQLFGGLNELPPLNLTCISDHCLTYCNKGNACESNEPTSCYFISSGYPELGNQIDRGFFRDLTIDDPSTPETELFKCLTYKCIEVLS